MAVIKVQSIRDIPKDRVYRVEATNKFYMQGNDRILKIFLDCYQRLDSKSGKDIYKILEILMSIEGTKHLILPEDIYLSDKRIYGYTTKYLNCSNLNYISRYVRLNDLLESYMNILEDLKVLAEKRINIFDIHAGNLLYNGSLYMLDFDLSKIDTVNSVEKIYTRAAYQVWQQILRTILYYDKYDLYTTLNHYGIRDFNLSALQCGIIDVTKSVEMFKESLDKSLNLKDDSTLLDIDRVLRRKKNGY